MLIRQKRYRDAGTINELRGAVGLHLQGWAVLRCNSYLKTKILETRISQSKIEKWLGRLDSNQGMAVPKTAALPLGYAPTNQTEAIGCAAL